MPFYAIEKFKNFKFQNFKKIYLSFLSQVRSPHLTLDIRSWGRGSPFVMRSRRVGLLNAMRIDNDSGRKFSKTKNSKVFLEITFLHSSCHPDHYEPKTIFWFFEIHMFSIPISKSPSHPRYTILGSRFPLCNAISEGRPPQCNTSSEAVDRLSITMYVSRMTLSSDTTFSKSKISKVFLEITFLILHSSCHPDHHEPKFFLVFRN